MAGVTDDFGTVPELLHERARQYPERIMTIGNDGRGAYRSLTYAQVEDLAARLAGLLAEQRAGQDEFRVVWVYGNSNGLMTQLLYHAVCRAGGVNVPVNPASTPAELADAIERTRPGVIVAPAGLDGVPAEFLDRVVVVNDVEELSELASQHEPLAVDWDGAPLPESPSVVLFTSGTTGRSKGVLHSHRSALAAGRGWRDAFSLTSEDVYQSMFPVYSGASLHFSGLACVFAGAGYVIDESRPTSASLERIDRWGATVYAAVPSVYHYWLAEQRERYNLTTLRLLDFGGSAIHRTTIESLRAWLPGVELLQTYGLTEAGPGGLYLPPADLDAKIGSIGNRGSGTVSFRLDPDTVRESDDANAPGRIGELELAGESMMLGYLDDADATALVAHDGWLRTGDIVRIDEDGYVFFLDRIKDIIVRGGFNISSVEIEEVVLQFDGILQAAAFGVPHDTLGEVVGLAVVPRDPAGFELDSLLSFIEAQLPRAKRPVSGLVLESLPTSTAGKVLKSELRSNESLSSWRAN